jgi:general secretion pathway protein B
MSFILDALRKSEHDRQRQAGPALVETAVAAPRTRTNVWATAAVGLLVVNLAAIGVLLLVKSRDEPAAASAPQPTAASQEMPVAASAPPVQASSAPGAQVTVTRTAPAAAATQAAPPPMLRPATAMPPATRNPLQDEVSSYGAPIDAEAAAGAAAPPDGPPAVLPTRRGTVVYETVPDADPAAAYRAPTSRSASSALPSADEITARGGLPELHLELHVYSTNPGERVVFVNGQKYREGDTTQEGAAVEEITREGVVMSLHGSRFLLSSD